MTPTELRALILASGLSQSELARQIGMAPRSMRRMLAGETPVLPRTERAIRALIGGAAPADRENWPCDEWPRDEWIVGEGPPPRRREYVIHTIAPRFTARVVAIDVLTGDPEPDEEPVDLMSGVVYACGDETALCEIAWIDPAPTDPTALRRLIDRAADQLEWDAG